VNTLPNPLHGDWVDSMGDWAVTHQQLSEGDLDRFIAEMHPPVPALPFGGCDCTLGLPECQCCCRPLPAPAEACTELGAETEPPRVLDTLRRQRAITAVLFIVLGALISAASWVGYFRAPT